MSVDRSVPTTRLAPAGTLPVAAEEREIHPLPTENVRWPLMMQGWHIVTFLHWSYEPDTVQRLLPPRLHAETFGGSAWVSLVPFDLEVRLPAMPPVPWVGRSPETNLRTYVRGPDDKAGIWFLSVDIARLAAMATARAGFFLPYMWSRMRLEEAGSRVAYSGERRFGGPGVSYSIEIERGERIEEGDLSLLDHYLTARWTLYTAFRNRLAAIPAQHPPWSLHRAEVIELDGDLLEAAGLPPARDAPLAHYSDGVDVKVGFPRPAA
jgi:uncharacterized protein